MMSSGKSETPTHQRIQVSIRFAAFLLVFVSGIALLLTDKLFYSSLVLMTALPLAWFFGRRRPQGNLWEIASFFYLLFFFFDLFRFSHGLAPALVHLFIFIMINKVFNLFTERDYYQLYLLTFLSILAASSLSVEFEMMYVIVSYILLLIWNVFSLTVWKEWKQSQDQSSFPFTIYNPIYLTVIGATTVAVFAVAMVIFFIMPRMQLGYFAGLYPGKVQHVSGFSQKVQLGEIAQIQQIADETMRVRVTSPAPMGAHSYYWRGIAFDRYDGKSWSTAYPGTRFLFQDSSNTFYNAYYNEDQRLLIKQEFYIVPLNTRVIFGQDRIVKVVGNFAAVTRDTNGSLVGMGKPQNYEVYSRLVNVQPDRLRNRSIQPSEAIRRYYTQLPFRSSRIEALAKEITRNANTVYDQTLAIRKYLEQNYLYTTSNLPQDPTDPVSVFLFDRKAGHCEYFATGMALLLRHLGIPCRVVNGFLQGEYNEIGDFFLVRQSHAHTWVEVYFGEQLWIPFDPSPRTVEGAGGGSWFSWFDIRKIIQSLEFFWDRYILIFSAQDQLDALTTMRDTYQEISNSLKQKSAESEQTLIPRIKKWWRQNRFWGGVIVLSTITICIFGYLFLRRRRTRQIIRTPILFYQEMLAILDKQGYTRPAHATPSEFIASLKNEIPETYVEQMASLTELFYKARFGHHTLSKEEQLSVKHALRRLQEMR